MKAIIVLLSLITLSLAGDLKFDFVADLGFIPVAASREYKTPEEDLYRAYNKVFNLRLRPALEYKFIYGIIDITSFSSAPKSGTSFFPFRVTWGNEIGLFYNFDSFRLSLGYEHGCSHRTTSIIDGLDRSQRLIDVGYDNIFIRLHYSNR